VGKSLIRPEAAQSGMSETGYQRLVNAVVDYAFYMLDRDGRVTSWNPGAEEIKGYAPAEAIGRHFSEFYTDEDRAAGRPHHALETARTVGRFSGEGWRVRKDGRRFWAMVAIDAIRDPSGEVIGFAKITRDMTDHRQAMEELRESERRFRLLIQGVTDYAIYMLDTGGRVTNWNAGAERAKGYKAHEIVGEHFSRFYTPEDKAAGIPVLALKTALETGRFEAEGWRVRKDGTRFWASVVIDAIRDESGELIGFAKVTRDLSDKREAQIRLEETRAQLFQSQKMEALGQLTGGLAHDFNNLLTVMLGGAEMARKLAGGNERLLRLLDSIQASAQRGAGLTRQLLAFARRQPLQAEVLDVRDQLATVATLLRHSLGGDVDVALDAPDDIGCVEVDASQLDLALLNLGLNARDAMAGRGHLTLSAEKVTLDREVEDLAGDYVAIRVADTGTGMTPEVLAHIFEPFFTTKDVGAGTGLGLSQAYGFARQSHGALAVASTPGEGTTVSLYLPVSTKPPRAPGRPEPGVGDIARARILVVEDDAGVAELACELMREMGHEPGLAQGAAAALETLARETYDMVFTDIMMPGEMNGLELAREVRRRFPAIPVLLTSGYSEAAAQTPPDFPLLTKPYQFQELTEAVSAVLAEGASGAART
jgi:PAS domain S-box-containing protein